MGIVYGIYQLVMRFENPVSDCLWGFSCRPWIPDSTIRGILAKQMLADGKRVPDRWLLDWVGFQTSKAGASSAK